VLVAEHNFLTVFGLLYALALAFLLCSFVLPDKEPRRWTSITMLSASRLCLFVVVRVASVRIITIPHRSKLTNHQAQRLSTNVAANILAFSVE